MLDGFQRQGARQLRQRSLGCRVGCNRRKGLIAGIRTHVHDGSLPGRHHHPHGLAGEQERAGGIDRLDAVPIGQRHLDHGLVDDDAGVVHQNVQPAVALHRGLRGQHGALFPGDVGHQGFDTRARQRVHVFVPVHGHHAGALLVQELHRGKADAAGRSGHDGNLAGIGFFCRIECRHDERSSG
ncbi:hypothetical protein D3C87_1464480 [compost metagenome]